ncbi:MAG: hypothetical protein LUD02_12940 [Tannerellaceae bacterium]|nr:hypothetical protein [Tannerellaceae bacterium]
MIGTFLIYMIKLACFLIVFYLGFKVLLSGETFLAFNRKVLLIGIGISPLLPGMRINLLSDTPIQQSIQYMERAFQQLQQISTPTATPGHAPDIAHTFSWPSCLAILYLQELYAISCC